MIKEVVRITVNGEKLGDAETDLVRVEVQEDTGAADVFRIQIAPTLERPGTWRYIDDSKFAVWNRISIRAGYAANVEVLIDGYITHCDVHLSANEEESVLELSGMDASAVMDLEEKQKVWDGKKDSEIAQAIFVAHHLSHDVEDTKIRPDKKVTTLIQRDSDIRFLRRLAARNGFECFVKGGKGYFRSPAMNQPPQKLLALQFGAETNLTELRFRVDGTPPSEVEARRVDPFEKKAEQETLTKTTRRKLGRKTLTELRSRLPTGRLLLKHEPFSYVTQMKARLPGAYERADQFVAVEGEIDSRAYGSVLRAKRLVTIKGAGAQLSGLYYVRRVRHVFTTDGYVQYFEAYRNGLGLTGEESFAAAATPVAIGAGIGEAVRGGGDLVLPDQQKGTSSGGGF